MLSGLMLTAFLMGLGGVPHCAAMCGAACAAMLPKGVPLATLLGRCLGYALVGAVAAVGFGLAAQLGRQMSFLRPLWILVQLLVLLLGLWMLWRGATPPQLDTLGRDAYQAVRRKLDASTALKPGGAWHAAWPFLAGLAWALLPCGLLYAALTVAALAPGPVGGALVMLAFALPSALGVWGAPAVLKRLVRLPGLARPAAARASEPAVSQTANGAPAAVVPVLWLRADAASMPGAAGTPGRFGTVGTVGTVGTAPASALPSSNLIDPRWAIRMAGLMLSLMSAWALYHQILDQWRAWCA